MLCLLASSRHAVVTTNLDPPFKKRKNITGSLWQTPHSALCPSLESPNYENNKDKTKIRPTSGKCHFAGTKLHLALHASIKIEPTYRDRERRRTSCGPVHSLWADGKWVRLHCDSGLLLGFGGVFCGEGVLCCDWSIWPSLIKLTISSAFLVKPYQIEFYFTWTYYQRTMTLIFRRSFPAQTSGSVAFA